MAPDSRKLLGTYRTPRFKIGQKVQCLARGEVVIVGMSDGRIQWPIAVRQGAGGRSLVLYRDLARAVCRETNLAVCHWWGVTPQTVSKWRKALGVTKTEATTRWRTAFGKSPKMRKAIKAMAATHQDPERAAKISAAKLGKPRPKWLMERLRKSNVGRKHTPEAVANMTAAVRKRKARPPAAGVPWTAKENRLLRSLPVQEVAERTGRTLRAVYLQRWRMKAANEGRI